ncbi:hypothetical protein Peur_068349 [Populus x canadensis]
MSRLRGLLMGHDFYKPTPFKSQHTKVTTQNDIMSFSSSNSKLGKGMSAPNLMLGQGRICAQLYFNPKSLRLSARPKGHSTLNLPFPESGLIVMMSIIILLNTNEQSMLTLIRCNGTSNKIILSYSYEITFLPLLRCMKQGKSDNIKEGRNMQKRVRKPYTLRQKHLLCFFFNSTYSSPSSSLSS